MTYVDREAALAPKFEKLANELPAALTAVTGDIWSVEIRRHDDGARAGRFSGAHLKRADGFAIYMAAGHYHKPERAEFSISWPRDLDGGYRGYRDAPGVRYDAVAPASSVAVERPAAQVAKQIVRALLAEPYVTAWRAMVDADARRRQSRDVAQDWRNAVSDATGIEHREVNGGHIWWGHGFCDLKSDRACPGGTATITLPSDPEQAAALLAKLREIMA